MKRILTYCVVAVLVLSVASAGASCANVTRIAVDFGEEQAVTLFPVNLDDGSTVTCLSATLDFTFRDDIVSACRVTLNYADSESAAAAIHKWEQYTGIEHVQADGEIVTYNYIIDPDDSESSTFSGKSTAEVITEVKRFGGVVREES